MAQIGNEVSLLMNGEIFIPLLGEHLDELPFQCSFALVAVRALLHRLVGGDNGVFAGSCNNIKVTHSTPLSKDLAIRRRKENLQLNVASSEQWLAQIDIYFIPTKLF